VWLRPALPEAELVIELRKIYWDDIVPEHFLDPAIDLQYPNKDYHRIYFGEILAIQGQAQYKQRSMKLLGVGARAWSGDA